MVTSPLTKLEYSLTPLYSTPTHTRHVDTMQYAATRWKKICLELVSVHHKYVRCLVSHGVLPCQGPTRHGNQANASECRAACCTPTQHPTSSIELLAFCCHAQPPDYELYSTLAPSTDYVSNRAVEQLNEANSWEPTGCTNAHVRHVASEVQSTDQFPILARRPSNTMRHQSR